MEELQGWWEVPTIAHFCYVFRAAFNLFHFEIEELEASLLEMKNTELPCVTVEQLAMRLLQGCFRKKTVNTENWEEVLRLSIKNDLSRANQHSSFVKDEIPFSNLHLREKVEVLLSLCEMRIDADDVLEAIKGIEIDALRIEPLGTDSQQNVYWYFFGLRLYKEDLKRKEELMKSKTNCKTKAPKNASRSNCATSRTVLNGSRQSSRVRNKGKEPEVTIISSAWSVVCNTLEDWENLCTSLCKSRAACDQKLGRKMKNQYLPMLQNVLNERERLKRKRMIEFAPRRTSARIDKVRQRELEVEKKREMKRELESAAKREAEKNRAAEERAKRARLRELRLQESENSNSWDAYSGISDNQSQVLHNGFQHGVKSIWTGAYNSDTHSEHDESSSQSENDDSDDSSDSSDVDEHDESNSDSDSDDDSEEDSESTKGSLPTQVYNYSQRNEATLVKKWTTIEPKRTPQENLKTYSRRDMQQKQQQGLLQLSNRSVTASITYHNFLPLSIANSSPLYAKLHNVQN